MLTVINPATEAVVATLEETTSEGLAHATSRARPAQRQWSKRPLSERKGILADFRDRLLAQRDILAPVLTEEMGKPLAQAQREIEAVVPRIDFFLAHAEAALGAEDVTGLEPPVDPAVWAERITYEPLGVIANISAWNYPYFVGANVFVPALLLGNAVLYKPSEHATLTGLRLAALLHEAGVPEDVFVPIVGGREVGEALLQQPIDGVFFTGSRATGRAVAKVASEKLIPVQLELGGKDPTYVCDDVNLEAAVAVAADGAFYNAGQSCCGIERIYVQSSIADAFLEKLVIAATQLKAGDPMDAKTTLGPLTRRSQRDVVEGQIADAVAQGAQVRCGGQRLKGAGYFFAPTVVANVDHRMGLMREESFAPVVAVQGVQDDAEAIALMNDSDYGLTAGVFCAKRKRAERILSQVQAGSVYWNCCDRVRLSLIHI